MPRTGIILVIDDNLATVGLIRDVLEGDGYRVLHAIGAAGIDAARRGQPGVILLDINMPGMDGPEVSRRLRADPATVAIPIVCMSTRVTRAQVPVGMRHDDCLPKPFAVADLSAIVARWIG